MKPVRLPRARRTAVWAVLGGTAALLTACTSAGSTSPAGTASTTSTAGPASTSTSTGTASPAAAGPRVFLASGQDVHGTVWYQPACASGCALSGDSTAFLHKMTWSSWSPATAVGTGAYELDACDPDCAAGPVYAVPAVVTLSQPVKVCSGSGSRWYWSRASFRFPDGLPRALQGAHTPQNPWVFTTVVSAAQQSCAS